MDSFSVLIGGKAGDGITQAGSIIAHLLNGLGYRLYTYVDSPSLIRGGHNYVIVRAHRGRISAHRDHINVMIALTEDTIERHDWRLKPRPVTVYDNQTIADTSLSSRAHPLRTGIPVKTILEQEAAPSVMRNSAILGAFCKAMAIPWLTLEEVIKRYQPKQTELNLRVARLGYELATEKLVIHLPGGGPRPVMTGLEATGLGLIRGGLKAYAAYPMTPASGLLHYLARQAPAFKLKVVQPEGEIAAMMMALGHAYAGERAAVGTSGGGFSLMVEGLSLAGQAELPVVVVLGQRPGPATGLPTYTAQADLHFALSAGHGEFPRLVVAPADVEQAYAWSTFALDAAWKYQMPAIVLGDRSLNDHSQSFDRDAVPELPRLKPRRWDGRPQKRAADVLLGAGAGTGAAREAGAGLGAGPGARLQALPLRRGRHLAARLPRAARRRGQGQQLHPRRVRHHDGGPRAHRAHAGQVERQGVRLGGGARHHPAGIRVRRSRGHSDAGDVGLADRRRARDRRAHRLSHRAAGRPLAVP